MNLTWLGTAGFIIQGQEGEIVFDPFLSRGQGEPSPFTVESFENARALFVGHGHFDHTYDIPKIVAGTELQVYAPGLTGLILRLRGVPAHRLTKASANVELFKPYRMRAFKSSHVRFDWPLVTSTLERCGVKGCLDMCGKGLYPKGLVQTYFFQIEGKKLLFISSAGCTAAELQEYRKLEVDYLLAPLQGHSEIQRIVAEQAAIIQPKVIIPHHHDDFYPPLSQNISILQFQEQLRRTNFKGVMLEIPLFQNSQI